MRWTNSHRPRRRAARFLADRDRRRRLGGADAHPRRDRAGQRAQHLRGRTRLALGHGRDARVAALAHLDVERDAAEVLELVALARTFAAAAAEDLGRLAAVRADEVCSCSRRCP